MTTEMPKEHPAHDQPAGSQPQPMWASILGGLGGLLAFTVFVLFLLGSCTAHPEPDGHPLIEDAADILSPQSEDALRQIRFPRGTPVLIATVDSIAAAEVGTYATDVLEHDPRWQTLRPRGWLRRTFHHDEPSGPGVLVLISNRPALLQMRFGGVIRMRAYQQGIAAGTWYREQQRPPSEAAFVGTVRELAARVSRMEHPWWLLGWIQAGSSIVSSEVEDFLAPSDGLYSKQVLRRYLQVAERISATKSAPRFVGFGVLLLLATWLVGKKWLIERVLLPRVTIDWVKWLLLALASLSVLGVLLTSFSALALLSRGRIEDGLALRAMGLPYLERVGFQPGWFSRAGGWWLAIPGTLVSLVESFVETMSSAAAGGTVNISLAWICWGCTLYVMPVAISIALLLMLIWKAGESVHAFVIEAARS